MPFLDHLARLNRRLTNPVARTFAGRVPPFALVIHYGRKSGREYRTPVWVFPSGEGFTIALTYGSARDWVRNVMAAGGFSLCWRGQSVALIKPRIVGEPEGMAAIPGILRPVLRMIGVTECLQARRTGAGE